VPIDRPPATREATAFTHPALGRHGFDGPPPAPHPRPVIAALACTGEGRCCRDPAPGRLQSMGLAGLRGQAPQWHGWPRLGHPGRLVWMP